MRIAHSVHLIQQRPGSNECWAAALAMALGRASNNGADHVIRLAGAHGVVIATDGGLPPRNVPNARLLARAVGMEFHDVSRNSAFDVENTAAGLNFLKRCLTPGLLVIMGGFNYIGRMTAGNHAITVFKIEGNDSRQTTQVWFVDPLFGTTGHFSYSYFAGYFMADPLYIFNHRRHT